MTTFLIALSFFFASYAATHDFEVSRQPTRFYSEIITVKTEK